MHKSLEEQIEFVERLIEREDYEAAARGYVNAVEKADQDTGEIQERRLEHLGEQITSKTVEDSEKMLEEGTFYDGRAPSHRRVREMMEKLISGSDYIPDSLVERAEYIRQKSLEKGVEENLERATEEYEEGRSFPKPGKPYTVPKTIF